MEEVVDYEFENETKIKDENWRKIGEMKVEKEGGGYVYTGVVWREVRGGGRVQIGGEIFKMVEKERKRKIYYHGEGEKEVKEKSQLHYRISGGIILKRGKIEVSIPYTGKEVFPITIHGGVNYHSVSFSLQVIRGWGYGGGFLNLYEIKEKTYMKYGGWVFNFKNEWGSNLVVGVDIWESFFEIVVGRKEYYQKVPWYLSSENVETFVVLVLLGSYVSI